MTRSSLPPSASSPVSPIGSSMATAGFSGWWGRHTIEPNRRDLWQIGPLQIWIQHLKHEWRIAWKHSEDWLDSSVREIPGSSNEPPPVGAERIHCVFGSAVREDLLFVPSLPNRPVIARPKTPLTILPNESVQLFVLTPLWLRIEMAHPSKLLHEIPTYRLSDTWFGPMSVSGEVCYASTSPAYLDLSEVPLRHHCAISAISIRNAGKDPLQLDRIKIPIPRLSLFYSPRTGFWTDSFAFERKEDTEMAGIKLAGQPPQEASPSQFVTGPRVASHESGAMIRAFSVFFRDRS